ncbi:PREDICTED: mediator of RNA polymerase II transcription subunit 15-like [Myotis brandtii]|uniref:mediator of RNA polymerase II transcription subunit 15-like n=1 Tax=Myotis brandtii TaxID=109478 RepID=UPI000703D74F|nr:PREDICTED: mediator of RNA polymerase II transcription subunit 15-like [Myotis brandtii]
MAVFQFSAHMSRPFARNTKLQPLPPLRAPRTAPALGTQRGTASIPLRTYNLVGVMTNREGSRTVLPESWLRVPGRGAPGANRELVGKPQAKASLEDEMGAETSPCAHLLLSTAALSGSLYSSGSQPVSLIKDPCDDIGPQDNLPSHNPYLNHVCKVPFARHQRKTRVSQNSLTMQGQQVQTPQSMPPPPQPSPQPGQPSSQPNSNVSSGPAPSPSSFLPSPSPQPSQGPVTARTPQNFSVPSPGPLNTPVNSSSVMSPAGSSQAEEQQYLDKLKQLSKYIEPLRRMINKIDKNEDRKKDLSMMKSLLEILTDPSKRCPLETLQKCEIALEELENDMAVPTPPPPPGPPTKQQSLCQPLLDAVLANIRSPVFNHSLHHTFVPAMRAIHGPPITAPVVCTRKRKLEEDEQQSIPNVLQREVARLDPKFLVNLDPSHCNDNGTVHLICKLDDKDLPSVPPLELSVPADYPAQSPLWIDRQWQYDASPFLQSVYRCMNSRLLKLPDKHSVTALLNTWAESIHQACLSAA